MTVCHTPLQRHFQRFADISRFIAMPPFINVAFSDEMPHTPSPSAIHAQALPNGAICAMPFATDMAQIAPRQASTAQDVVSATEQRGRGDACAEVAIKQSAARYGDEEAGMSRRYKTKHDISPMPAIDCRLMLDTRG